MPPGRNPPLDGHTPLWENSALDPFLNPTVSVKFSKLARGVGQLETWTKSTHLSQYHQAHGRYTIYVTN